MLPSVLYLMIWFLGMKNLVTMKMPLARLYSGMTWRIFTAISRMG